MHKRLVLTFTAALVALGLILPATAIAADLGSISLVDGYCSSGNTVNATFKLTKYSGYYATKLTMTAKGQGYHRGSWQTESTIGKWSKTVNTSARATMKKSMSYDPPHDGKHRILVIAKIWNGSQLMATGKAHTPGCV